MVLDFKVNARLIVGMTINFFVPMAEGLNSPISAPTSGHKARALNTHSMGEKTEVFSPMLSLLQSGLTLRLLSLLQSISVAGMRSPGL